MVMLSVTCKRRVDQKKGDCPGWRRKIKGKKGKEAGAKKPVRVYKELASTSIRKSLAGKTKSD